MIDCKLNTYIYHYGANASEAVKKIATDETYYDKCSFCVIVSI